MSEIKYSCNGPKYTEQQKQEQRDKHAAALAAKGVSPEEAAEVAVQLDPYGPGCGKNVTELINAVPEDGEVHGVECPNCGTVTTVRRAPAELVQEAAEGTAGE
jgi:hypothetical protein